MYNWSCLIVQEAAMLRTLMDVKKGCASLSVLLVYIELLVYKIKMLHSNIEKKQKVFFYNSSL